MSMVKKLYTNPYAVVLTGNILSKAFPLQRGTHQGCPLPPLLFLTGTVGPDIRLNPHILPVSIQDTQNKISLYADDVLL